MKNKNRKLRAARVTFLALLGGVVSAAAISTTLVSCNDKRDYYGKQKAVISSASQSGISIAEQKTLDNGDMQITFTLPNVKYSYFLESAIIQANGASLKDTEFKVSKTEGIITIYSSALKTYKTVEKFVVTPLINIKRVVLDKTSIELGINETTTLKMSLSDGDKKEIESEITKETLNYIEIGKGSTDGTITIKGLKENSLISLNFNCEGYMGAMCNITVTSKKNKFIEKANIFSETFTTAKTEYTMDKIKVYNVTDAKQETINSVTYDVDGYNNRYCDISLNNGANLEVANIKYSGEILKNDLKDETESDVTYSISDDEISYHDGDGKETSDISINKNGYVTKLAYSASGEDPTVYTISYTGDPQ